MNTRQPRLTRSQWAEVIDRQSRSGQTIRVFCEENNVGFASFGKWKQTLTRENAVDRSASTRPKFQPVSVSNPESAQPCTSDASVVTLALGASITLTIQTKPLVS